MRAREIAPWHPCSCLRACTAAGLHPGSSLPPRATAGRLCTDACPPPLHSCTATCSQHCTFSVAHSQRRTSELEPRPHPPSLPHPPTAGRCGAVGAVRGSAGPGHLRGRPRCTPAPRRPGPPRTAARSHGERVPPPPAPPALHFPSSALITPSSLPSLRPSGHRDERGAPVGAGGSPAVRVPGGGGGGLGRAAPRWRRNGGGLTPRAR